MRFLSLFFGTLAAALAPPDAPPTIDDQPPPGTGRFGAGYVLSSKIKWSVLMVYDHIEEILYQNPPIYMNRARFYTLHANFSCTFYKWAYDSVGEAVGSYTGPINGDFVDIWVTHYQCARGSISGNSTEDGNGSEGGNGTEDDNGTKDGHSTEDSNSTEDGNSTAITGRDPIEPRARPCGFVNATNGYVYMLNEGPKGHMFDFATNGELYSPVKYRVSDYCECQFYDFQNKSAQLIQQITGPANGNISSPGVSQYQCWLNVDK